MRRRETSLLTTFDLLPAKFKKRESMANSQMDSTDEKFLPKQQRTEEKFNPKA